MKKLKLLLYRFYVSTPWRLLVSVYLIALVGGLSMTLWQTSRSERAMVAQVETGVDLASQLAQVQGELAAVLEEDQVKKNASLSAQIKAISQVFDEGATLFERRSELTLQGVKTAEIEKLLAKFLGLLSERKWAEARTESQTISDKLAALEAASAPKVSGTAPAQVNNALPGSGFARQAVATDRGQFTVAMVVAPGARVVVETSGEEGNCVSGCSVAPLAELIARSGGFAGINGAYFCPPDYARCQGKENSFDTLAVNGRTKVVFNRENNVYSTVPLVAAYGTSLSFYDQTVQWGVDTSGSGALANFPRLLRDGSVATDDNASKGTRGFIGTKDGATVIGHVFGASYADTAEVLKVLGLQNALNLDGGGSSALWFEGSYKVGPGRTLPTAIVLVR